MSPYDGEQPLHLFLTLIPAIFAVVVFVYVAARMGRSEAGQPLWKRLAYVAITRAQERLIWVVRNRLSKPTGALRVDDLRQAAAPALTEALTNVPALRGFAGTSVLIIVGVATDTVRRIRAEKQMAKYGDVDSLYDKL